MQTKSPLSPARKLESYNARQAEMQWLREHADEYPGEWVAVDGGRLIAHGADAKQVFAAVDQVGVDDPLFVYLEAGDNLLEIGG